MQFKRYDLLSITFSFSCLPLLFLSSLPSTITWFTLSALLLIITLLYRLRSKTFLFFCLIFLLGFLWSTAYAKQYLENISIYIDKQLSVTAQVISVNTTLNTTPKSENNVNKGQYIQFKLLSIGEKSIKSLPLNVYWDREQQPFAGQIWKLAVKIQVVHSNLNEGGFDSQRFAMTNRGPFVMLANHRITFKIT